MIRVVLPAPLRRLAQFDGVVEFDHRRPVTQRKLLDALEQRFPMLRGTTRDHHTQRRRAYVRFFGCGKDISDHSPDEELPAAIVAGEQPFLIIGAVAGG